MEYLRFLREITEEYNIVLIFDEVVTCLLYTSKKEELMNFGDIYALVLKEYPDILTVDAVSYTHLDVYKRQLQTRLCRLCYQIKMGVY